MEPFVQPAISLLNSNMEDFDSAEVRKYKFKRIILSSTPETLKSGHQFFSPSLLGCTF